MSFIYKNNTASKLQISTKELSRRDGKGLRSCADGEGGEELPGSVALSGQAPGWSMAQLGQARGEGFGWTPREMKGWL